MRGRVGKGRVEIGGLGLVLVGQEEKGGYWRSQMRGKGQG